MLVPSSSSEPSVIKLDICKVILGLYWDKGKFKWQLLYYNRGYIGVILG